MVNVLWSVDVVLWWVDEWMHVNGSAEGVQVEDVEDFEFSEEWLGVCLRWFVAKNADDFFVHAVERLEKFFVGLVGAPDRDGVDEVWVDESVVELCHCFGGE